MVCERKDMLNLSNKKIFLFYKGSQKQGRKYICIYKDKFHRIHLEKEEIFHITYVCTSCFSIIVLTGCKLRHIWKADNLIEKIPL